VFLMSRPPLLMSWPFTHLTPLSEAGEMANVQWSIVIFHLRCALRADICGYKQMPREAHPQLTNDY
jgi:hypothetical protein